MARYCVGIDLGGTSIKAGILDENRSSGRAMHFPTPMSAGRDAVVSAVVDAARSVIRDSDGQAAGIGIGSPGPIHMSRGVIVSLPNIPGMANVPLRDLVAEATGLPVVLENDANAAALGEYLCGAAGRRGDMVLLTLGTGVGSGIIVDGRVLHGWHEIGAELGHLIVQPDGEACNCGQKGCLERYSSATCMADYAMRLLRQTPRTSSLRAVLNSRGAIDSKEILEAALAGDELAKEVWDRSAYYLGVACVSICRVFDPDRILLGGGLASAGEAILQPVREHFRRMHWKLTDIETEIQIASLGIDAGFIGAAGAAWAALK
jgi:glucokinase